MLRVSRKILEEGKLIGKSVHPFFFQEAEQNNFTAEELQIALELCDEENPVTWLRDNWQNMIDTVATLATNYGHERKENNVGTISQQEAREALRLHKGNVWSAVTECVEQRQKKVSSSRGDLFQAEPSISYHFFQFAELTSRGNFTREDVLTVLTANHGNLEAAYIELSKTQLKPFLMRIWGPPAGIDNEGGNFKNFKIGTKEKKQGKSNIIIKAPKKFPEYIGYCNSFNFQTIIYPYEII